MSNTNTLSEFLEEASAGEFDGTAQVFAIQSKITGIVSVINDGQEVALFWSDLVRAELWNNDPDCVVVGAPYRVWGFQMLPDVRQDNIMVGLNWGETESVYTAEEVIDALL